MITMYGQESGRISSGEPEAEDVRDLTRQAAMHAARGEHAQALRCYEMALLVDETQAATWFHYGNLQQRMGLTEDAVESFEFALRQEPRMYAARFCLAQLMVSLGRPLIALSHFALVTVDKPGHLPAWRNLIELQRMLGDLDAAAESTRRALQHLPGDGELAAVLAGLERELAAS
jgi:tetratricopeptide (TPR) repeat protein